MRNLLATDFMRLWKRARQRTAETARSCTAITTITNKPVKAAITRKQTAIKRKISRGFLSNMPNNGIPINAVPPSIAARIIRIPDIQTIQPDR